MKAGSGFWMQGHPNGCVDVVRYTRWRVKPCDILSSLTTGILLLEREVSLSLLVLGIGTLGMP